MVYLILNKATRACKIGYTNNVKRRVRQLQTGSSEKLELMTSIEGSLVDEKELHRFFNEYRITGEWFTWCEDIRSYFSCSSNGLGIPFCDLSLDTVGIIDNLDDNTRLVCMFLLEINLHNILEIFTIGPGYRRVISEKFGIAINTVKEIMLELEDCGLIVNCDLNMYKFNPQILFKNKN